MISKYNPGVAAIYTSCNVNVLPVAVNTGVFWKKNALIKLPGTFVIEFLPIIKPGLKKQEFLDRLQAEIETASNRLLED